MSISFAVLLVVWLSSLQATSSLESLSSAFSKSHRQYCTKETEYCNAFPMDEGPTQDATMESQVEGQSQEGSMDTSEENAAQNDNMEIEEKEKEVEGENDNGEGDKKGEGGGGEGEKSEGGGGGEGESGEKSEGGGGGEGEKSEGGGGGEGESGEKSEGGGGGEGESGEKNEGGGGGEGESGEKSEGGGGGEGESGEKNEGGGGGEGESGEKSEGGGGGEGESGEKSEGGGGGEGESGEKNEGGGGGEGESGEKNEGGGGGEGESGEKSEGGGGEVESGEKNEGGGGEGEKNEEGGEGGEREKNKGGGDGKTTEKMEVAEVEEGGTEAGEQKEAGTKSEAAGGEVKNDETPKRKNSKADDPTAESKKQKKDEEAEEKQEDEPLPEFPTTLAEFGYAFNEEGRLRYTETGEPFVFVVKEGNHKYNQGHYEALGEVMTEYVYKLLETEGHLLKTIVPVDIKKNEPTSFVFESADARSNPEKLMVLIHGSGVVRAGQWARRLIINDCLDSGTQLPFIKRAREEGYGVVVLNPNRNIEEVNGKKKPIRGNSSPEEHAKYVWKNIIKKCAAKDIYVVAHSYGGKVTTDLADVFKSFRKRVKKIAFTDSVHSFRQQGSGSSVKEWLVTHSRSWISSTDPLDTEQKTAKGMVPKVSAGTPKHEETSYFSMDSIFKFFTEEEDPKKD